MANDKYYFQNYTGDQIATILDNINFILSNGSAGNATLQNWIKTNCVTITDYQTIAGWKDFTNGIKVGSNLSITGSSNSIEHATLIETNSLKANTLGSDLNASQNDISNINWLQSQYSTLGEITGSKITLQKLYDGSIVGQMYFGFDSYYNAYIDLYGSGYIKGVDSIDTNKLSVHDSYIWTHYDEYNEGAWVEEAKVYYLPDFVYNAETSPYARIHQGALEVPKTPDNTLATESYVSMRASVAITVADIEQISDDILNQLKNGDAVVYNNMSYIVTDRRDDYIQLVWTSADDNLIDGYVYYKRESENTWSFDNYYSRGLQACRGKNVTFIWDNSWDINEVTVMYYNAVGIASTYNVHNGDVLTDVDYITYFLVPAPYAAVQINIEGLCLVTWGTTTEVQFLSNEIHRTTLNMQDYYKPLTDVTFTFSAQNN